MHQLSAVREQQKQKHYKTVLTARPFYHWPLISF